METGPLQKESRQQMCCMLEGEAGPSSSGTAGEGGHVQRGERPMNTHTQRKDGHVEV